MRKLKFTATLTLKDDAVHVRLVVSDQEGKTLFDRIGRTAKLAPDKLKKIPSNEGIVELIKLKYDEGIGDFPFEKVKDNLEGSAS